MYIYNSNDKACLVEDKAYLVEDKACLLEDKTCRDGDKTSLIGEFLGAREEQPVSQKRCGGVL